MEKTGSFSTRLQQLFPSHPPLPTAKPRLFRSSLSTVDRPLDMENVMAQVSANASLEREENVKSSIHVEASRADFPNVLLFVESLPATLSAEIPQHFHRILSRRAAQTAPSECPPPVTLLPTASSDSLWRTLMKRMLLLSLVACALPLAAQQAQQAQPAASAPANDPVVAALNGETITASKLDSMYARLAPAMREQYNATGGKAGFLDNYLRKR